MSKNDQCKKPENQSEKIKSLEEVMRDMGLEEKDKERLRKQLEAALSAPDAPFQLSKRPAA